VDSIQFDIPWGGLAPGDGFTVVDKVLNFKTTLTKSSIYIYTYNLCSWKEWNHDNNAGTKCKAFVANRVQSNTLMRPGSD